MPAQIEMPTEQIVGFCRGHAIRRLWLFGSVLRDDFRAESDVDFLVEFDPDAQVGLLDMAAMEIELGEMLGRKVDLRTPAEISPHFRGKVLDSAELQYDRG
jgi:predicted nucleotidyltransferase